MTIRPMPDNPKFQPPLKLCAMGNAVVDELILMGLDPRKAAFLCYALGERFHDMADLADAQAALKKEGK